MKWGVGTGLGKEQIEGGWEFQFAQNVRGFPGQTRPSSLSYESALKHYNGSGSNKVGLRGDWEGGEGRDGGVPAHCMEAVRVWGQVKELKRKFKLYPFSLCDLGLLTSMCPNFIYKTEASNSSNRMWLLWELNEILTPELNTLETSNECIDHY